MHIPYLPPKLSFWDKCILLSSAEESSVLSFCMCFATSYTAVPEEKLREVTTTESPALMCPKMKSLWENKLLRYYLQAQLGTMINKYRKTTNEQKNPQGFVDCVCDIPWSAILRWHVSVGVQNLAVPWSHLVGVEHRYQPRFQSLCARLLDSQINPQYHMWVSLTLQS